MADIDNAQVKEFCNGDLRQIADLMTRLVTRAEDANETYLARDLGTVITTAGAANKIADGSERDGRTRCTGGDVFNFVTLLTAFSTFMTAGNRNVLAKWKVNGDR